MSKLTHIAISRVGENLWQPFTKLEPGELKDLYAHLMADYPEINPHISDSVIVHCVYRACQKNGIRTQAQAPLPLLKELSGDLNNLAQLTVGGQFALGAMYYEDEAFEEALGCFEICLTTANDAGLSMTEIFPVRLLIAYTCENVALRTHSLETTNRGIELLADIENSDEIEDDELLAEAMHALGHLHVAKEQIADHSEDIVYGRGSEYLHRAAKLQPEFYSCFTASFSEIGQYEKTAAETIKILSKKLRGEVSLDKTSEMELIFYLGASYLFLSEYDLARRSFNLFRLMAESENLIESKDYAQFYLEKIELKRTFLQEYLDSDKVNQIDHALSQLNFRSYQSEKLRADCNAHIACVKNLSTAIGRNRREISTDVLSYWIRESLQMTSNIGITGTPLVSIFAENQKKADEARCVFSELNGLIQFELGEPSGNYDSTRMLALYKPTVKFKNSVEKIIEPRTHTIMLTGERDSQTYFLLSIYLLLANRILSSVNSYIFRLSPCEDATTTKSQRPQLSLGRLTEPGLQNHAFGL